MKFEIKSRRSGKVIFSLDCESFKVCVQAAVKSGVDLSCADLSCADLSGANLYGADLSCADLSGADLSRADLSGANLYGADLSGANLSGANLYGSNLSRADLYGANLSRADLSGANLYGSNLSRAKGDLPAIEIARRRIVPEEGAFVGWKKLCNGVIARLVIPHDAERVNAISSRKCRASKVFVHELFKDGETWSGIGIGQHDNKTQYKVGKETVPDKYDPDVMAECSHGIHFFLTRAEAEAY